MAKINVVWCLGLSYLAGCYLTKKYTKWGMLTASGLFQKVSVLQLLFTANLCIVLDKMSDSIHLILKNH